MLATAAANSVVAIRITRRGPYLSSMGPISGEQTASSSVLTETAADTCVRPQPNSAASGLMKTLMLARKVGEMLNASPMTQDSRTTGAYLMHPLSISLYFRVSDRRSHHRRRMYESAALSDSRCRTRLAARRDANETNRRKSLFVATQSG